MSSSKPVLLKHPLPTAAVLAALGVTAAAAGMSILGRSTSAARLQFSHVALVVIALTLLGLALRFHNWTRGVFARFFLAAGRPLNLAIYRVVLFGTIFFDIDHDASRRVVTFFADLPRGLQVPPPGLGPLLDILPINSTLANLVLTGLTVFSFLAMIGLFTRLSAIFTVCCALYGLGIAQFYGQVNHYHHVIWFAAILAASRCGDVLSVDAFLLGRKRGLAGASVEPPSPSRAYVLPLRFVWILIGIVYFFPGFWKYWRSGMDWAFSENFVHQLHLKWMQRDWISPIRVDYYPLLYMPAAFATLVWEIGFLPAMFFPRVRAAFAVVGACFHVSTRVLMHISFWTLQSNYLSFFNWDAIFRGLGQRFCREEMFFLFDGNDAKVRARVAAWRTLDVFLGRVTYVNMHDSAAMTAAGVQLHDAAVPASRVASAGAVAIVGKQAFEAGAAWGRLARRIPPLWPALPFVGRAVGGEPKPVDPASTAMPWLPRTSLAGVIAVFAVLVAGNTLFGVKEQRTGYPFTCYPPFSLDPGPEAKVIHIEPIDANGEVIAWDEAALKKRFGSARYVSLIKYLRTSENPKAFHAFWEVVARNNPRLRQATAVRFWETTLKTDPKLWGDRDRQYVSRKLVYTHVDRGVTPAALTEGDAVTTTDDVTADQPAE
jgi:hypothetical protein